MKLIPFGDKFEVRLKGPYYYTGYWKDEIQTLKSFDKDGSLKLEMHLNFKIKVIQIWVFILMEDCLKILN